MPDQDETPRIYLDFDADPNGGTMTVNDELRAVLKQQGSTDEVIDERIRIWNQTTRNAQ